MSINTPDATGVWLVVTVDGGHEQVRSIEATYSGACASRDNIIRLTQHSATILGPFRSLGLHRRLYMADMCQVTDTSTH